MELATHDDVAANVRAELARRDLRQHAVGEWLNLDQRAVSRRVRGDVAWSVAELRTLASRLGISLTALIGEAAS